MSDETNTNPTSAMSAEGDDNKSPEQACLLGSLEGTLLVRRGKKSGKTSRGWLQCYVVLNLADGGSISCYNNKATNQSLHSQRQAAQERLCLPKHSMLYKSKSTYCLSLEEQFQPPVLKYPSNVPWIVKNMNDETGFVVEIDCYDEIDCSVEALSPASSSIGGNKGSRTKNGYDENHLIPLRAYFRCSRKGNEKPLWLDTLSSLNRLSHEVRQKKGMMALLSPPSLQVSHTRVRNIEISRESQVLEQVEQNSQRSVFSEGDLMLKDRKVRGTKEYLVYPTYAYPNR